MKENRVQYIANGIIELALELKDKYKDDFSDDNIFINVSIAAHQIDENTITNYRVCDKLDNVARSIR